VFSSGQWQSKNHRRQNEHIDHNRSIQSGNNHTVDYYRLCNAENTTEREECYKQTRDTEESVKRAGIQVKKMNKDQERDKRIKHASANAKQSTETYSTR